MIQTFRAVISGTNRHHTSPFTAIGPKKIRRVTCRSNLPPQADPNTQPQFFTIHCNNTPEKFFYGNYDLTVDRWIPSDRDDFDIKVSGSQASLPPGVECIVDVEYEASGA